VYGGGFYPVLRRDDGSRCILVDGGEIVPLGDAVPGAAGRALSLPPVGTAEERLAQLMGLGAVARVARFLRRSALSSSSFSGRTPQLAGGARKYVILGNGLVAPVIFDYGSEHGRLGGLIVTQSIAAPKRNEGVLPTTDKEADFEVQQLGELVDAMPSDMAVCEVFLR
jgi:hypothetical protein